MPRTFFSALGKRSPYQTEVTQPASAANTAQPLLLLLIDLRDFADIHVIYNSSSQRYEAETVVNLKLMEWLESFLTDLDPVVPCRLGLLVDEVSNASNNYDVPVGLGVTSSVNLRYLKEQIILLNEYRSDFFDLTSVVTYSMDSLPTASNLAHQFRNYNNASTFVLSSNAALRQQLSTQLQCDAIRLCQPCEFEQEDVDALKVQLQTLPIHNIYVDIDDTTINANSTQLRQQVCLTDGIQQLLGDIRVHLPAAGIDFLTARTEPNNTPEMVADPYCHWRIVTVLKTDMDITVRETLFTNWSFHNQKVKVTLMDKQAAAEKGLVVFVDDSSVERAAVEEQREVFAAKNKQLFIVRVYRAGEPHPRDLDSLYCCVEELSDSAKRCMRQKGAGSAPSSSASVTPPLSRLACTDETLDDFEDWTEECPAPHLISR